MICTRCANKPHTLIVSGPNLLTQESLRTDRIGLDCDSLFDSFGSFGFACHNILLHEGIHVVNKFPNAREPPFDILLSITCFSFLNQIVYMATLSTFVSMQFIMHSILLLCPIRPTFLRISKIFVFRLAHCMLWLKWEHQFTTSYFVFITHVKLEIHSDVTQISFSLAEIV